MAQCTTHDNTSTQNHQNQKRGRHLYAQKLNNSAAKCIEVGLYDRAISSLSKALKLSEQDEEPEQEVKQREQESKQKYNQNNNDDDDDVIMRDNASEVEQDCDDDSHFDYESDYESEDEEEEEEEEEEEMMHICPCYYCTVDGCIEYSEKNSFLMTDDAFCLIIDADSAIDSSDDSSSFIYRRPIQVTPQSIQEEHNMGSTLCLIIAFNLALAYHLKAITVTETSRTIYHKYMSVATKLYTHVIRWQTRLVDENYYADSTMSTTSATFNSMRFKMILLSNMSQIHRSNCLVNEENNQHQKNKASYQLCLELLLSNIMIVVEYKTRIFSNNNNASSSLLPYIMMADLERFLQNTSPILMGSTSSGVQDQCASVA